MDSSECIFLLVIFFIDMQVTYVSTEHPAIDYFDPKCFSSPSFSTRRRSRNNPIHYVNLNYTTLMTMDNNFAIHFFLYEWLTNQYKRSFVEFHFLYCDLIKKDMFFGPTLREQPALQKPCPHPAVTYFSTEHPAIDYFDPKCFSSPSFSTRRRSRNNPIHYINLNYTTLMTMDNNIAIHFFLYEWLTNQYKRSFVEFHFLYCDLIKKDMFFGPTLREQPTLQKPCPHPAGFYSLKDMSIPPVAVPANFPFRKGRMYSNCTYKEKVVARFHIDFELKTMKTDKYESMFPKV
ncbi:hypothetical protein K1T71_009962 [Dendrolimus kikuchii]|uniref:Uncharacterized protein n=1 Tax=Dendrolimus kikuchii TaxID=765133 RepID=A0ACC1CT34_9NEOP|nr:hypothetical protein K1T71_009962 [Dendrolimus kikuchii]